MTGISTKIHKKTGLHQPLETSNNEGIRYHLKIFITVAAFLLSIVLILYVSRIADKILKIRQLASKAAPCTAKVYIGTASGQLAISTDGGETWTRRDPMPAEDIISIFALNDHVYVGTDAGLAVSKNGGHTWAMIVFDSSSPSPRVAGAYAWDSKVVAGSGSCSGESSDRYAFSNDNGQTWPTNLKLPNPPFEECVTSVYAVGGRSFIGTSAPYTNHGGLGISDDNGKTWKFIDQTKGLGNNRVRALAAAGNTIYVGLDLDGGTISISEDGGRTWGRQNTTKFGSDIGVRGLTLSGSTLYVATSGGGMSMSNDVWQSWTTKTTIDGLASNKTFSVGVIENSIFVGTDNGLSISHDAGKTWATKSKKQGLPSDKITAVFAHWY